MSVSYGVILPQLQGVSPQTSAYIGSPLPPIFNISGARSSPHLGQTKILFNWVGFTACAVFILNMTQLYNRLYHLSRGQIILFTVRKVVVLIPGTATPLSVSFLRMSASTAFLTAPNSSACCSVVL